MIENGDCCDFRTKLARCAARLCNCSISEIERTKYRLAGEGTVHWWERNMHEFITWCQLIFSSYTKFLQPPIFDRLWILEDTSKYRLRKLSTEIVVVS